MKKNYILTLALTMLLMLAACDTLPDNKQNVDQKLTLIAMLEPGSTGLQKVHLTHPVSINTEVNYESTWQPGAWIQVMNTNGDTLLLDEDDGEFCYIFDRSEFPLLEGDSVGVRVEGEWNDFEYVAEAWTSIVSQSGFSFVNPPSGGNLDYPADSLMFFDEERESNFTDVTAFMLDWTDNPDDGVSYEYQIEFLAVSPGPDGEFIRTPGERLYWLRDDKEDALQPAPYPDIRLLPGPYNGPRQISWYYFIFVDGQLYHEETHMGYNRISVRRINHSASRFYATTHMWNRDFDTDPVEFNLLGAGIQGVVGSSTSIHLRLAIVDD